MPYSIIETPDHLHRSLHLFAAGNLESILGWLDTQVAEATLPDHRLPTEERWFLTSLKECQLTRNIQTRRLLARKEAREFFSQHPEFRKGATYRTNSFPGEGGDPNPHHDEAEQWLCEYEEFEYAQDVHGNSDLVHTIENVRSAIRTQSVSAITDELESLGEMLAEVGFQLRFIFDALDVLHELFDTGANDTSRYLDTDADEAFEVTRLCRGEFRKLATNSVHDLRTLSPYDFECLCAELLGQFGLTDVSLTPVVADGGVDIVAFQVLDGTRIKYIIQCKRNAITNKVDVRVVRELAGVKMDSGADRAIVITTSEFTKPAIDFARRTRTKAWGVRLVDHRLFKRLLDCAD